MQTDRNVLDSFDAGSTEDCVMQIILYYAPIACSLVPYVTLTEAKANFELRPVNLRKGQKTQRSTYGSIPNTKFRCWSSMGGFSPKMLLSRHGSRERSPKPRSCPPIHGKSW